MRFIPPKTPGLEEIVAQRNSKSANRKGQLSTNELRQLVLWGGILFTISLGLVYFLVRTGTIIPHY
jgi:hypothetical protein